jgi:hypothetical protein
VSLPTKKAKPMPKGIAREKKMMARMSITMNFSFGGGDRILDQSVVEFIFDVVQLS